MRQRSSERSAFTTTPKRPLLPLLLLALAAILGGLTIHFLLNPPQQTSPAQSSGGHA